MPSTHAQLGSAAYETLGRISGSAADIRSGKDTNTFSIQDIAFSIKPASG
jgi:hypothetical protein